MDSKKFTKFNLYLSGVLLVVFLAMLVSTTAAYFTDSKQITNTITSGEVKISLTEAAVKSDENGNLIEDTSKPRVVGGVDVVVNDYGKVYPGQSIFKDPTIINIGSDDAWIAAKVTLTDGVGDLTQVMGYEGREEIDIELLLSGGLLDETVHFGTWNNIPYVCYNDRYAMIQSPNAAEGKYEFYFLMLSPVEAGDSVMIFDHINFPNEWDGAEMQQLVNLKVHVQAFGVQTFQFESCFDAMTKAFPTYFEFS